MQAALLTSVGPTTKPFVKPRHTKHRAQGIPCNLSTDTFLFWMFYSKRYKENTWEQASTAAALNKLEYTCQVSRPCVDSR